MNNEAEKERADHMREFFKEDEPTIHYLKIWPQYFDAVVDGSKTFEIREKRDRIFKVGDILHFECYYPSTDTTDGRTAKKVISYTLDDPAFCLPGFIIMGLHEMPVKP